MDQGQAGRPEASVEIDIDLDHPDLPPERSCGPRPSPVQPYNRQHTVFSDLVSPRSHARQSCPAACGGHPAKNAAPCLVWTDRVDPEGGRRVAWEGCP